MQRKIRYQNDVNNMTPPIEDSTHASHCMNVLVLCLHYIQIQKRTYELSKEPSVLDTRRRSRE